MHSRTIFTSWLIGLFFIPLLAAQSNDNAGFVDGLWYSEDTFFASETIRLYVAIRNNTGAELSGTVTFYDNENIIARKSINALDERIVESWADWTPAYGQHTVRAELSRLELSGTGEESTKTTVTSSLAEDMVFVDEDTDGDGVGNQTDTDDDGDGIADGQEVAAGTDPLVFDEPVIENETKDSDQAKDVPTTSTNANTATETGNLSEGLEQYLTPSRADTLLSSVTDLTQTTKEKLDDYRQERALKKAITTNDPDLAVDSSGFGEIIRTTKNSGRSVTEKPEGFFGDLITLLGTIVVGLYTALLTSLSFVLSYPILIQVGIMLAILYTIFKLAQRFGNRPSS